jgi:putative ABC transport system permease protein
MFGKIPLAWLQLSHEKIRLLVAIAGISFADILMFMQLGFRDALFDSAVTLHKSIQGDVFLISPQSTSLIAMKSLPLRRLYQTRSVSNVAAITPIYLDFGLWKNPENKTTRSMMVIGYNPADRGLFELPGISKKPEDQKNIDQIMLPDTYLFDVQSREQFGDVGKWFKEGKTVTTEMRSRQIKVGGLFTLGASFGADGNVVTSDTNFNRLFRRDKGLIDIGVVRLQPGSDLKQTIKLLDQQLPDDVKVLSREEFINFELNYWQTGTSIGFIFTLGTIMGFIVGIVIVYQILYTDVADHLPEYATLKAMGYTDFYLLTVVFQEAVILAIVGFFPGMLAAAGLYTITRNATNLPLLMTLARATTVLILTLIMCLVSGAIAVRKLQAADPADMF